MKRGNSYYRARIAAINALLDSDLPQNQRRWLQNGYDRFAGDRIKELVEREAAGDAPLTFAELATYSTWFELHPEKVAGELMSGTSIYFPVIVKGTKADCERMFAAALAAEHDAEDEDLELLELESKALEMELQLALSAEGGESVDGTATDKISVAFNKAIMQYKKGFFKSERTQIFVCKAPQFWSKKGLAIEDVYITVGVIKKAIEKHDLKIEHFINFPDMLREKTNLFISKTTQNAFVQLTELKDLKNHKIVVAVHLKKDKNGNVIIYDIRSVHGRVQRQIDKWIKQGLTIKNKSN